MAGGLVGLLDDVAALAKLAAASIDDVGVAAGKASAKAAGVVIDDTAVTPQYVQGLAADRELPIIKQIAVGSLRNKLLFIVPVVLILNEFVPILVDIILIFGGLFLCYEGAHKIIHALIKHDDHDHDVPDVVKGPDAEKETIAGAIRTDFILSGEIMVIALDGLVEDNTVLNAAGEVIEEPSFLFVAIIMVIVALLITIVVYGLVAAIVKMDDVGLKMTQTDSESSQKLGRAMVNGMPVLLKWLTVIGTGAMLWVGGHILVVGVYDLGLHGPEDFIHAAEELVIGVAGVGGFLAWLVNTAISAVIGFVVGSIVATIADKIKESRGGAKTASAAAH